MDKKLTLQIYPKHNKTACFAMKDGERLHRINHLADHNELVTGLKVFTTLPGLGKSGQERLELNDKKANKWVVVFCYVNMDCRYTVWRNEADHSRAPEFCWTGATDSFTASVQELLKMLE